MAGFIIGVVMEEKYFFLTDGWMDDFQFWFISTVFQSYQDSGWMILKGCVP